LKVGSHVPNGFVIEHMLKQECPKVCHLSLAEVEISISQKFFSGTLYIGKKLSTLKMNQLIKLIHAEALYPQ